MDSKIGLLVQLAGVSLITLLTLFLRRSINVPALRLWTNAWLFLSFALFCLRLAFSYDQYSLQLFSIYFLTEYAFGFLIVAGCRSLTPDGSLGGWQEALILPFVVVAFSLPFLSDDFNLIFNIHSLILSGFFLSAFIALWRTKLNTFGWRVMLVALGLLTIDFVQYFVVFSLRQYFSLEFAYLEFNSVIDLVLQILLGFGMVIVLLELVLADARNANEKLRKAQEKLEQLAHVDPLTTALNRHAFHGYLKRRGETEGPVWGSLGFFDIDDLKTINDIYGHEAGDVVIRSVVRAIRDLIRAEDLIFRWGGDEFFVLMISMDAESADRRMSDLDEMLSEICLNGSVEPLSVRVSHAFEDFSDIGEIEEALRRADAGMYKQKQRRKAIRHEPTTFLRPAFAERGSLVR